MAMPLKVNHTNVSTNISTNTQSQSFALSDIERMAEYVAKSNLFGIRDKNQAVALLLLAQSEGLHPMMAVRKYHIIQGKPAKSAETMLAEFKQAGGRVKWHELTDKKADATFISPDGDEVRITWTLEDAKRAGLLNRDNWQKYPRAMLRSRVVSEGIRTIYPQVVLGVYTPDEVIDIVESEEKEDNIQEVKEMEVKAEVVDEVNNINNENNEETQINEVVNTNNLNNLESIKNTLNSLGMDIEVKDGFARVIDKVKGASYTNRELLKQMGFKFHNTKKIWYKKL